VGTRSTSGEIFPVLDEEAPGEFLSMLSADSAEERLDEVSNGTIGRAMGMSAKGVRLGEKTRVFVDNLQTPTTTPGMRRRVILACS
jgi:hypothetical protein